MNPTSPPIPRTGDTVPAPEHSLDRYAPVLDLMGEGLLVFQDGRTVYANPQAAEILQRPLSDILDRDLGEWLHPEDRDVARERQIRRQAGESLPERNEVRVISPDGGVRWVEVKSSAIPWEGHPSTITFFHDITPRRQTLEALARSEERYRAVIEQVGEGMVVLQGGQFVFANRRAGEIFRVGAEALMREGFLHHLHPDDQALLAARSAARARGERNPPRVELRIVHADGSLTWIEVSVTAVSWEGQEAALSFFSDVTTRHATLEALGRSEERYRAVIEHVGEGMVVVQDNRFVFVNRQAAEICRISRDEMMAHGFLHLIHPEDRPLVKARHEARLRGEAVPDRYELRLVPPTGDCIWVEIGVTLVPWDGAQATLTFFSDVSHRKHLEAQLRATLAERETILDNSVVGIAFLTPDGRLRWANPAMTRIFHTPEGDLRGESMERFYLSRAHYLEVGARVATAILSGQAFQEELMMRRHEGDPFWVSLSGKAVSRSDLTQGTVWAVIDISRRKKLEADLQRTSQEREAVLNTALVGMVFAIHGRVMWVNDKLLEMAGLSREAAVGQPLSDLLRGASGGAVLDEAATAALRSQGRYEVEAELLRSDGDRYWGHVAGRCVQHPHPDAGVIWTVLDTTARRHAEENIRHALDRQKELNELRSRFVAMTSHEFRTPLATILSSAELIRHYGERLDDAEKLELLQSIEANVARMTGMLDRVLLIGRADAELLECNPRPLSLRAFCDALIVQMGHQFPDRLGAVALDYQGPDEAVFDPALLQHVFGNLVSNAIKYSPAGGQVHWRIRHAGPDSEHPWQFEVQDQGIGIPASELPHLFESFQRASNVGSIQGTGLGLAIVKKSCERMGGRVRVQSDQGQGSIFFVELP